MARPTFVLMTALARELGMSWKSVRDWANRAGEPITKTPIRTKTRGIQKFSTLTPAGANRLRREIRMGEANAAAAAS